MEASSRQKAIKRLSKQKINMATGNVASYSDFLNGPHQLVYFQQENNLSNTLGDLNIKNVREKEETAEKK